MSVGIVWIGFSREVLVGDLFDTVQVTMLVEECDKILEEILFVDKLFCRIFRFGDRGVGILCEVESVSMSCGDDTLCWYIVVVECEVLGVGDEWTGRRRCQCQ